MIPVKQAPEPETFDALVRQPGLSAIAELVGEPTTIRRRGPKRKKVADHRSSIPADDFPPLWRKALDDLVIAYDSTCAYWCLRIHQGTGNPTVDHFAPKSRHWDKVYEWSNYRLACQTVNGFKREFSDVIDPFLLGEGLFALDLVSLKVVPGTASGDQLAEVRDSITRLRLDSGEYSSALEERYQPYRAGEITFAHLRKYAPFLALEIERQGRRRPED